MRKILFAAMAAMVMFASCDKNEGNDLYTGETKNVFMKLEQASGLRAVTDKVTDYTVEFSSGFMYFVDASNNITKRFTISSATTDGNNLNITSLAGTGISGIVVPASSKDVYVVANVPTGVTLPNGGLYSAVEDVIIKAASQKGTITSGAITGVMLYSSTPGTLAETTSGAGDWSATVSPKQIANRLEITDITGKANSGLDGFRVIGIYVNYFYQEKKIGAAASPLINYESDASKYASGQGLYTMTDVGVFFDEPNADATSLVVAAGTNKVWGYNLLAGAETPHIIIKLDKIAISSGFTAPTYITGPNSVAFVTVKGFLNGTNPIDFSNGGYVYTVAAGALQFGLSDITEIPEVQTINTKVKVQLTEWVPVPVTPVI